LQKNTHERVPLEWAKVTGNQGDALLLAERRGDVEMTQLAVRQIEAAFCDIARRRGCAFRRFL
jgi:hypothetical protein